MPFFFGYQGNLQSVKIPTTGLQRTQNAFRNSGVLTNGGGWVRSSAGQHYTYQMNWDFIRNADYAQIRGLFDYGELIHFLDPQAAVSNALPPYVAQAGDAARGGYRLVGFADTATVTETSVLTPAITTGPTRTVRYAGITSATRKNIWCPIPTGYTLHLRGLTRSDTNTQVFIGTTPLQGSVGTALFVNGVSPGRASTPDNAALDITGDIDLRAQVALDDWTPSATQTLISKFNTTGNQRSYRLIINTSGNIGIGWSVDGITGITDVSTAAVPLTNGAVIWVRATLDVDNGASGHTSTFYTSPDGTSWTTLGTAVTTAGVTSIFSGTAALVVGARNDGTAEQMSGRVLMARVRNGIAGTVVANPDFNSQADGTTSFVDPAGRTWTVTAPAAIYSVPVASMPADAAQGANLSIGAGADIDIRWLQTQVLPTGQVPVWTSWMPGMGHSGCRLDDVPNYTLYSAPQAIDYGGLGLSLRETGAWE